ncbi:NUDIX domain-containing protein, partial [Candidatus Peregrinibacteria bacterium]|nr:NUDIX domain-containing protein [Candidatus Peregrinibacteria bacterium]
EGKVLLLSTKSTGRYWLPGGGLNPGESLEEGMRREVMEEAGIEIEIGEMVKFKEIFFYYEPLDEAYHTLAFFYRCAAKSVVLLDDDKVDPEEESEKPRWIDIKDLRPDQMQHPMAEILPLL